MKTQDSHKVNLRAGSSIDSFSLELYVANVFNNKAYTSIGEQGLLANNFPDSSTLSTLVLGLPDLRTYGMKVGYRC